MQMGCMDGLFLCMIVKHIVVYQTKCIGRRTVQVGEHEWTVSDFQADLMDHFWENNGHLYSPFQGHINWRYPSCVGLCKGYVRECKAVTLSIVLLFLEASSWHAAICTSWSTGPKLGGSSGLAASPVCLGRKLQSHPSWIWYFSHMVCLGESFCASRVN